MIPWNGKKVNREFINSISGDWKIFMEKDKNGQIFGDGCRDTSRRQLKSFSVQQFFKNAAEVWASSPHLRSKSKLHHEIKQTSKNQSEESQLLLKSKGRNEIQGFRGNCDSQASWGCAPALPNRIREIFLEVRFLITSRRQTKSFSVQQFFKNAAEVWASSPHLRSKFNFAVCFSCCNCMF